MRQQTITKLLNASQAGIGSSGTSLQLANCRLIGLSLVIEGDYSALATGIAWITKFNNANFATGTENILAFLRCTAPQNAGSGMVDSIYVPLAIEYKFPESVYLWVYSSAAAGTTSATAVLYILPN